MVWDAAGGGQRKDQGNAAGPRVSSASTCRAAWVPPLREVGGGPLADSPRPLGRGPAGSRRCGRCGSPHSVRGLFTSPTGSRVGRGRGGGRSWTAGLQVPAGRPGAGPAGGEGVWGRCGNSSLPGHGPTGVGAVGGFQVLVRAGRHGCHRCGRSAGGRLRTRHVHSAAGRQGAAAAGGAGVHTRCGDSSPHRLGVGSGGDGAGADRGPPAFKFRQEGLGPALRGAREFGAGVATLAFPDTGRLGSVPWAARGPGAGLGRRVTPAGLGPGPGGRARASGQRRRRAAGTPSSWSGGGQRAGDVSRGSGGISRGLGLKVSGD